MTRRYAEWYGVREGSVDFRARGNDDFLQGSPNAGLSNNKGEGSWLPLHRRPLTPQRRVAAGTVAKLQAAGVLTVSGTAIGARHGIAVFWHEDQAYAVDNRCPHMGFPLARGTCKDGVPHL